MAPCPCCRSWRASRRSWTRQRSWSITGSRFYALFQVSRHINVLELRALIMFVKHLVRRRRRHCHVLIGLDSRVVLGAAAKWRSSSTSLNFHLRRLAELCVTYELTLILSWLPTWGNPADAPSRLGSLAEWKEHFPAIAVDWDDLRAAAAAYLPALPAERRHRVGLVCDSAWGALGWCLILRCHGWPRCAEWVFVSRRLVG